MESDKTSQEEGWLKRNVVYIYGVGTFVLLGVMGAIMRLCG